MFIMSRLHACKTGEKLLVNGDKNILVISKRNQQQQKSSYKLFIVFKLRTFKTGENALSKKQKIPRYVCISLLCVCSTYKTEKGRL